MHEKKFYNLEAKSNITFSDEASSHGKSSKVETKEEKNLKSPNSQGSDVTVTTTGSSVSIPSSISQSDPARQTVLTPSGSSSKSSTGAAGTLKRLSIEPVCIYLQNLLKDIIIQKNLCKRATLKKTKKGFSRPIIA